MRFRNLGLGLTALTAIALLAGQPADAQKKQDDRLPQQRMTVAPPVVTQYSQEVEIKTFVPPDTRVEVELEPFSAYAQDLRGSADVTHRGPVKAALQGFRLRFLNGDHKIRALGLMNFGEGIRATLADEGNEDPFEVSANFVAIPNFMNEMGLYTVSAERCNVRCTMRIEGMKEGQTALLAGFEFSRGKNDRNVRGLSVEVLPDREIVNVALYDDRGPDFSGFLPIPGADIISPASALEPPKDYYSARVQVLLLPERLVRGVTRVIGTSRGDALAPEGLVPEKYQRDVRRPHALMGFGLSFNRSDHFIEHIGVDHSVVPSVHFQDGDTDDEISWFYDLAVFEDRAEAP